MKKLSMGEVLRAALRIFGYLIGFGFIGFMFVPSLISAGPALRIPIVGMLIIAAGMLLFMDGSYRGARDSTMTATLARLSKKGDYNPTPAELAKQYDWRKGVLAAALAALPLFIVAVIVAITVQPYAYTVQDYPAWLKAYTHRPEIGEALTYMDETVRSAGITDYLRIFVRFMLFPYVGLLGTLSDEMSLLFDRLSPAIALILPTVAAVGYLFGPRRRAKEAKAIKDAKSTPRKRLKKDRKKQTGPKEKKQLV